MAINDAIKRVFDKLSKLSKEEFHKKLIEHENGDIAEIIRETKTLEEIQPPSAMTGILEAGNHQKREVVLNPGGDKAVERKPGDPITKGMQFTVKIF